LLEQVRSILIKNILKANFKRQEELIKKLVKKPNKNKNKTKEVKNKRLDYNRKGKWTKELIIKVLKEVAEEYGKLTYNNLARLRSEDPQNYPAPATVRLRFGSWEAAKKAVGGNAYPLYLDILGKVEAKDVNFFLNVYHQGNVETRDDYIYARKKFPQAVPPYHVLLDTFGSFKNFKRVAEIDSCRDQLDKLLKLTIKLNCFPSKVQCKVNEIDVDYLIERFETRKELKEFILDLKSVVDIVAVDKKKRKSRGNES